MKKRGKKLLSYLLALVLVLGIVPWISLTAKATEGEGDQSSGSSDESSGGAHGGSKPTTWTVTITPGENMTRDTTSGLESQQVTSGQDMTRVVYTAAEGYYFPTKYSVAEDNGIKVKRYNFTQITVSGTPTADVTITLPAATEKATQTITAGTVEAVYGATNATMNASTDGGGTLSYAVKSGGDVIAVDSAGNITTKKVGTAIVTVTAAETENYKEATKDVTVNVTQAPPTADNYDFTPAPTDPTDPTDPTEPNEPVKTIDMFRLYNPNSGEHFYTGNEEEKDGLVALGWNFEGIAWTAPVKSKDPVYRLYNPNAGDHHYTMNKDKRDILIKLGWNDEGIGWYSVVTEREPIYRLYNPNATTGTHHFTASEGERDYLISLGWKAEGIGWYGIGEDAA